MSYQTTNNEDELDDDFEAFLHENGDYSLKEVAALLDEVYHNQIKDFTERVPRIVLNGDLLIEADLFDRIRRVLGDSKEPLNE